MRKRPELFNAAGKLMCYLHREGRCSHTGDHDDKTHASPTKAQLAIYKEWKAQKEGGKPPAAPKPKAVPKKAAPATNEAGDESSEAPKPKQRGRSASRNASRKRDSTPAATPAVDDCDSCLGDE